MLLIVKSIDETKLCNILDRWEVSYARIGRVTDNGLLTIRQSDRIVASAPARFIAEAPLETHSAKKPVYLDKLARIPEPPEDTDLQRSFLNLLGDPNIASTEWIYRQYDHEV